MSMSGSILDLLAASVAREREQTRFYRRLAAWAEDAGDAPLAERANALLADEQHHVSRLTARILELGGRVEADASAEDSGSAARSIREWEDAARSREDREVAWYENVLDALTDEPARRIVEEILRSERHHARALGGKWMPAEAHTEEASRGDGTADAAHDARN